jgi:hypothetical protein
MNPKSERQFTTFSQQSRLSFDKVDDVFVAFDLADKKTMQGNLRKTPDIGTQAGIEEFMDGVIKVRPYEPGPQGPRRIS